jgi:hypothetical protein
MATMTKSWKAKMAVAKSPKRVQLETDFSGIKAGSWLYVGTPLLIDQYIRKIPYGETRTVERMRRDLARQNKCDATCPVSTAIFVRMTAEAAWEDISAGVPTAKVSPFWRAIEPDSRIAKKLPVDSAWIAHQRAVEAAEPTGEQLRRAAKHAVKR